MRKLIGRLFVFAILVGTLGVSGAKAQIGNSVEFKVSSSFAVGDVTFPAGSYSISPDTDDEAALIISASDGKHSAIVSAEPMDSNSPRKSTEIIFNKYGNTLVMKQMWVKGSMGGYLFMMGRVEKKAAKTGKPTKQSVAAEAK